VKRDLKDWSITKEFTLDRRAMFLRQQGEARRSTPFQLPRRRLGEYKATPYQ
jgi:hypothetical protein